jgi:hypothetical protein
MTKTNKRLLPAIGLMVILVLLVFQCSSLKGGFWKSQSDVEGEGRSGGLSTRKNAGRDRITPSNRQLRNDDPLDAHQVNVDAGECIVLLDRLLSDGKGILLELLPQRIVREDGSEEIRVVPRLFDGPEESFSAAGFSGVVSGDEVEEILDEGTRQKRVRFMAMAKGMDVMTMPSQVLQEGQTLEVLCCPGKEEALVIDARLKRDRDGTMRVKFGEPYLRPSKDGDRPEE